MGSTPSSGTRILFKRSAQILPLSKFGSSQDWWAADVDLLAFVSNHEQGFNQHAAEGYGGRYHHGGAAGLHRLLVRPEPSSQNHFSHAPPDRLEILSWSGG
ncbi:MAG: hypothetical protein DMG33_04020 [Acidobacteria bacterium]|nr:MAG: hypothetical protein DMG33_04020 [Acidobacteriota bacterium]